MSNWIAVNNIAVFNKIKLMHKIYFFFVEYTNQRKVKEEKRKPAKFTSKIPRYFRAIAIFAIVTIVGLFTDFCYSNSIRETSCLWMEVTVDLSNIEFNDDLKLLVCKISDAQLRIQESVMRKCSGMARCSSRVTWMTWGLGLWIKAFVN